MRDAFKRSRSFAINYTAEPTARRFHASNAFYRSIRGPLGSGKSVTCAIELIRRAREQQADARGIRPTRWGVIRNSYPMLESTTIKTWQDWVPDEVAPVKHHPILTCRLRLTEADGTTVDCEIFFVSMDKPDDVAKLKSMDLTGIWLNEVSELPKSAFDMATGRVGRFPPKMRVPLTWCGVISDTNSMDDEHWHCKLEDGVNDDPDVKELMKQLRDALAAIGFDRELMNFFVQPPALVEANGTLIPNPLAENARNQPLGMAYWLNMVAGKDRNWINVYILNRHGRVVDGLPCYPEYIPEIHGKKRILKPYEGLDILIGMDFGLSPAIAPVQCTPEGRLLVLGELCAEERSMGTRSFIRDCMTPYLSARFGSKFNYKIFGDPAGGNRAESDENNSYAELESAGYAHQRGRTNDWLPRRESVAWFLSRIIGKQPAFQMDESCRMLRAGFEGRYHYRRLRVAGSEPRYEDKAYKNKWSHCLVAGTMVMTDNGEVAIERIAVGDTVLGPTGWRRVSRAWLSRCDVEVMTVLMSNGRALTLTPDHKIFSNGLWVRADELQYGDILECIGEEKWTEDRSAVNIPSLSSMASSITGSQGATIGRTTGVVVNTFIARCGWRCVALFRRATTSIMSMRTKNTTISTTSRANPRQSMPASIRWKTIGAVLKKWGVALLLPEKRRAPGMVLRQVSNFIAGSVSGLGWVAAPSAEHALIVAAGSMPLSGSQKKVSVRHDVRPQPAAPVALMMNAGYAASAGSLSRSTNTQKQRPAVHVVRVSCNQKPSDVYDLTVEVDHAFYAEGVMVHNCHDALQYPTMEFATVGLQEMGIAQMPAFMKRLKVNAGGGLRPYQVRGGNVRRYEES